MLLILHIALPQSLKGQAKKSRYAIDNEQVMKKKRKKTFSVKRLFQKDVAKVVRRQNKKEDKHRLKVAKANKKAIIKYQKRVNNNNESGKNKKVYKRMQEFDKEAKRRRHNKYTKNFFHRFFSKSKHRKTKRKKS